MNDQTIPSYLIDRLSDERLREIYQDLFDDELAQMMSEQDTQERRT